jgi:SAM-dependent methyltransferase
MAPDFLLARVADDFAERLGIIRREFHHAASVGAFNGLLARRLSALPNVGDIIDVDPALRFDTPDGNLKVAAEEEALPFAVRSLDLAVSGLSLQLVNDVPGVLVQLNRALKPDGLLLAALLGGETLTELREAWLLAETEMLGGASPRVAPFADVRDLGRLLQRAGFALPVADSDIVRVTYASPLALMREIKAMGASNMLVERRRTPVTRGLLLRAAEIYQERFGLPEGRIPATFEIITLTGWVPHASQQKPLAPGSAKMRLADVLKPRPKNPEAKE